MRTSWPQPELVLDGKLKQPRAEAAPPTFASSAVRPLVRA